MSGTPPKRRYRRHGLNTRGTLLGQPEPPVNVRAASIARRYARQDRRSNPIYCQRNRRLIYDQREVAKSTGQQLERITGTGVLDLSVPAQHDEALPPDHDAACPGRRGWP
jgi:hypothetical protein